TGAQNGRQCIGDFAEGTGGGNIGTGIGKVRMIESIEEFRPELQIRMLRKPEILEDAEIQHPDPRTMELARPTGAELSRPRLRKCGLIDQESRGCIQIGIGGSTSEWISNAVGIYGTGKT